MSNDPTHSRRGTRGGPTKLTSEVVDIITRSLRMGAFVETAAAFAGVHRDTYYDWMKRGRAKGARREYREFVAEVDKAMATAEMLMLQNVTKAEEWQASAWRLERRYPDRWGKVDRLKAEHMGKDGMPLPAPIFNIGFPQGGPGDESGLVVTDDTDNGDIGAEG